MSGKEPAKPTFARQPRATATPAPDDFAPLIDESQWTQAASLIPGNTNVTPSERIGRFYNQNLNELDPQGLSAKLAERTAPASPQVFTQPIPVFRS